MTLRGRLTTAFLAVVLGPVLLGSFFVGITVATVSRDRTVERLDHAATTVRTAIGALCRQLQTAADAVAVLPAADRPTVATQLVGRGIAAGFQLTDATGHRLFATPGIPPAEDAAPAWRDCAAPEGTFSGAVAIIARAEDRDGAGRLLGSVTAAQWLDEAFVERLAGSTGVAVTLLTGTGAGADVALSTEPPAAQRQVAALAAGLSDNVVQRAISGPDQDAGRYVRRLPIGPGQPLPLALSLPSRAPTGLYVVLLGAVVAGAGAATVAALLLAHSTTRPLADLAHAVGRVADGDLTVRVPVLRQDELGRLAGMFNRMTRELRSYVHALTTSRDQLRSHLAIIGDTLSSTHDLRRILRVILQSAMAATGARAGAVFLVDPRDGALVARCAEGLPGAWAANDDLAALRVPLGEGLLGAIAATGEARRGRDVGPCGTAEPQSGTYIAVPICAPAPTGDPLVPEPVIAPTTLGVLALYDRLGGDEFDDADLVTLRTFAGQAGVAVNNVRVHEEAQRLSLTDPLTGLWNYRYLQESIRREVERASRFGRMLTVLALDIDHFKEVNDRYGHAAGDTVLDEFARRVRAGLREVDLAFRQGGEEFVVLLPETDAYGGIIVAERLGAAVRDMPVPIDSRRVDPASGVVIDRIPISVSIGIAVFPEHGAAAEQVLDAADDALYAAKAAGRDTYRLAVSAAADMGAADVGQEIAVRPAAQSGPAAAGAGLAGGAPGGPQPPRQSRGR